MILLCADIDENSGPKAKPNDNLSVYHWNVNSTPSHNFQKIAVLESFVAMNKFDIICISETFLNITYEDNDLNLNGYSLLRADNPSNEKMEGVCIYNKETLAVKVISMPYLSESILCEVTIGSKKCIIGPVCRSPSQDFDELESFLSNFEFLLPISGIMITQQLKELNLKLETIYGFQQLIDEPTHISKNGSSCIDLIFTNQPNLIANRRTHPFVHENQALRSRGGRGGMSPPKFFVDVPFKLISPLNVLFLKEVTKNVHENQQSKSRTSSFFLSSRYF